MAKFGSRGTILQVDPDGGTTYTDVAGVRDINGPGQSSEQIDVTSHDSTGNYREFLAGLKDGGEISFELVWDTAAASDPLGDLFENQKVAAWRIIRQDNATSADRSTQVFKGAVVGASQSYPLSGYIGREITIKVSGSITTGSAGA